MKLFSCPNCAQTVYFENIACEHCGARLAYDPATDTMRAFDPFAVPLVEIGPYTEGAGYKDCTNRAHGVCNWLLPAANPESLCLSCRHNEVIPNLSSEEARALWARMEGAKHRLVYTILKLGLPLYTRQEVADGLGFRFLQDNGTEAPVMTGHDDGLITIALAEADDAERERRRSTLGEPYRTLLGHFRHEVGHWYWDRLVRDGGRIDEFRAIFGDESRDYAQALQAHYANGPQGNWADRHISAYAASHPWEDFAETFAHYCHVIDTLETASCWGLAVRPRAGADSDLLSAHAALNVYGAASMQEILDQWLAVSAALNALNRSMGLADAYPFVISEGVRQKLAFVHDLVRPYRPQ